MNLDDELARWIDAHHPEQVDFLRELVRVPSDTPPGDNAAAAEKAAAKELIDAERLSAFRKEWFEIREEILRLMERFRSESGGI